MDGNVRLQISAAINAGLIDNCNGVVKEGKEALVYHADGGWKGRQALTEEQSVSSSPGEPREFVGSDGYDVAVKVFKRVVEFKGRLVLILETTLGMVTRYAFLLLFSYDICCTRFH